MLPGSSCLFGSAETVFFWRPPFAGQMLVLAVEMLVEQDWWQAAIPGI